MITLGGEPVEQSTTANQTATGVGEIEWEFLLDLEFDIH